MRTSIFTSVLLASLFITVYATATPRVHDECQVRQQIIQPQGSHGYYMNEDCNTAYVLPPDDGQITVGVGFNPSRNDCEGAIAGLNALNEKNSELLKLRQEKAALVSKSGQDQAACRELTEAEKKDQTNLVEVKTKLLADQTELNKLKTQRTNCSKNPKQEGCDDVGDLSNQITDLNDDIQDLKDGILEAKEALSDSSKEVRECLRDHPLAGVDSSTESSAVQAIDDQIAEVGPKIASEIRRLSKLQGAEGSMGFYSSHTALVNAFTEANRGKNVTFLAMPIKDAQIIFPRIKKPNLSTVAAFTIFGVQKAPADPDQSGGIHAGGGDTADVLFGGAAGSQIILNLYSSCRLMQQFGNLSTDLGSRAVANLIKPTVKYTYELQASKNIHIKYDEAYLYKLIKSHEEHGGLFWTSSATSILESTVSNRWLTVVVESEDKNYEFKDPEALALELRREVLNAALLRAAKKTYVTTEDAQADGGTPPKDGAKTAAEDLHKCANVYCQVAAFALDITDAMLGGSESTGTTMKTVNLSEVQNLMIKGNVEFMGGQTFKYGGSR